MATSTGAVRSRPLTADRNRVDLTWERCQEQALHAFRTNDAASARANWARALDIAERHFERGDPRIAASLSNHAFALLRQKQLHQANSYFQQAVAAWEESWRWIPWMAPSAARGEAEAAPYDQGTQDAFYALIKQGQAMTETLWREGRLSEPQRDAWQTVKPRTMTDIRRLFSAVFLMPTAKPGGQALHHGHRAA